MPDGWSFAAKLCTGAWLNTEFYLRSLGLQYTFAHLKDQQQGSICSTLRFGRDQLPAEWNYPVCTLEGEEMVGSIFIKNTLGNYRHAQRGKDTDTWG